MKKVLILGIFSIALFSCKTTATGTKNDVATQVKLKGEWTLVDVNYPSGYMVTSFDIADAKCLEGSQWKLIPNNNSGTLTLNNPGDCPAFNSRIVWNVKLNGDFNLKFLSKEKAKHVTTGYVLTLANLTDSSFELIDNSTEATIVYSFKKNNK